MKYVWVNLDILCYTCEVNFSDEVSLEVNFSNKVNLDIILHV